MDNEWEILIVIGAIAIVAILIYYLVVIKKISIPVP
jgi:FtsZ-interacting cell division protein ZipA